MSDDLTPPHWGALPYDDKTIRQLQEQDFNLRMEVARANNRITALTAENERLREAGNKLYEAAYHGDECPMNTTGAYCNCGFEEAEVKWKSALAGKDEK